MQYGYPQWGGTYGAPNFSGWATPTAPNQAYGAQVGWTTNAAWPTNVGFQTNRPATAFQHGPVINGPGQAYSQQSFVNQPGYAYSQGVTSNPNTPARPIPANASNQAGVGNKTGTQAAAPRRDINATPAATRSTHNQIQPNGVAASQPASATSAGSSGPAKNSPTAVNSAASAATNDSNDNYNTGIKLQEVRIGADKALKVMKITPGSSAELCGGIHVGDRLVRIGDVDVFSSYDTARVRDLLSGPRGSRIRMVFENALKAEVTVELVRNVRSIKRSTESSQQAPVSSPPPAAPTMQNAGNTSAANPRRPDADAGKSASSAVAATNRPAQNQGVNGNAQSRPATAPQKTTPTMNAITQGVGGMQIRTDQNKMAPVSATGRAGALAQPQQAPAAGRPAAQPAMSNMVNRAPQTPVVAPAPQGQSQFIYQPRPITGPFGQYNSMQYTIIGGSLAGSVVGGSHAGSVVGDSLTPSLVIGDWFGGDYV